MDTKLRHPEKTTSSEECQQMGVIEQDNTDSDCFHDAEQDLDEEPHGTISEIVKNQEIDSNVSCNNESEMQKSVSSQSDQRSVELNSMTSSDTSLAVSNKFSNLAVEDEESDYMNNEEWKNKCEHIFILSEAGKPIYSLHGSEDKLATIFGVIQALVSFVQHGQDAIISIHAHSIKFVFLVRNSLILVAASRSNMSVQQLQMQLSDVYSQILSTLTYSHMNKIFEKRKNFDLRRLLSGSERLIYNLLSNYNGNKITNNVFASLTNSIRVLPLSTAVRSSIASAIQSNCSKIKNLVFAVLIANNKLISLVRMKKYSIHPADLRLIFNLIECSESFKASENWTPICLPKFDMNGYLHAHVSYLSDDCQACLLLLSVDRDAFFTLSDAKSRITEKLRRNHCLDAINEAIKVRCDVKLKLSTIGVPDLRHFLYKPKSIAQLLCSELVSPYTTLEQFKRLQTIYCDLLHRIQNSSCPLKLIYEVREHEVVLAWITAAYGLYAVFEPTVDKSTVIKNVDKLLKWVEKESEVYFIRNHPTF
ncbi:vacuolar fusion protein MON1 homolog A [Teleopsis dalmanni]|uniref:vacuolar fusion protein MON1 homolog A n=1 Tax=Teleopsis dalmanni TaxID=139649 RepID=UPI0018CEA110|nr:vacuolar fusion protein MON1 homolog A [Teleopsis dalmanni]